MAETYTVITSLDQAGQPIRIDRSRPAHSLAAICGDPLVAGEAARNLAVLTRHAGWYPEAGQIAIGMAEDDML